MDTTPTADHAVDALIAAGLLAADDRAVSRDLVARALAERSGTTRGTSGVPKLVEVVAYLGAALVLAAGFLFLATTWDDLSDTGQVGALALVALVLGIAGGVAVDRADPHNAVRRRLSGTLMTGGALAAGLAAGVALEVWTDSDFDVAYWPVVAGGVVLTIGAALAYRLSSTALGVLAMLGGPTMVVAELAGAPGGDETLWIGCALFATAALWIASTEIGAFTQQTIARAAGLSVALGAAQVASFNGDRSWVGYLLMLLIAGAGIWLYLSRLDWPYLAAAVLAVTMVVPEAVSDWTDGDLGVVGGVLVAGITLLLASFAGFRLRTEVVD